MPTRFHDKHRRAKRASRRLQLAFWLSLLLAHLGYTSVFFLPLIGLVTLGKSPHPIIASGGVIGFLAMPVIISLVAALYPTSRILTAYHTMRRTLDAMTVDEQAASLGATPACPNNDPAERRYTNLIAELSLAADIDEPDAYVLRDDHSINAFALSDTNGDLALAVSQGALDNLSRDELQAVLAHEFGHIENGDPVLYNRLTAMLSCYYSNGGGRRGEEHLYTPEVRGGRQILRMTDDETNLITSSSILYLYGRLLQAAFARHREEMADARAVQYTRDSSALVGALKKAYALHTQGIHPRRSPLDRAHIYFIDYRRPGWRRLQTHPTLRERIKTWGGGNISGAELRTILSNIDACRNNRAAAPLQPIAPLPEPNPSYPPATYDRLLAAKLQPAPDDPVAALLAYFAYHSGAAYAELEKAALLPEAMQTACRRAYNTIEQSDPLQRLALIAYLSRAALNFNIATKRYLDPIIRRLIQHDGELSRYEHTAYLAWRATCIPDNNDDYRAHETAIAYLYNYLAADDPDDPNPQSTYQRLLTKGLALSQPPAWRPLNTDTSASSLQLCRHGDTLRRLARPYRQSLHNSLANYYRQKPQLTLKQAHLRFALQHLLIPQALPAGE